jgi:hypothetical protein
MNEEYFEEEFEEEEELEMQPCAICGKLVPKLALELTTDCHGIPFRYVCPECYEKIMEEKGYDGEYYTELDECLDYDY